ncbi:MAG: phosphate signaling complex protein PhoU [Proteobacteria bacterium]|nr:phosphate signaling complex protein PhoU [Pseudomonadota bacterium]
MNVLLRNELEKIRKKLLEVGGMAEDRFRKAVKAIKYGDLSLCEEIISHDFEVDNMEVEVEEDCLKVLALHQPVAGDLRFLIVVIKINNDLERIADQAVNIAQRVVRVQGFSYHHFIDDYETMADMTGNMLKMSLDAFVNMDTALAESIRVMDNDVDEMKNIFYDRIKAEIMKTPEKTGKLINLLLISRHLERIADHATNIAEEVIYMKKGEIIRHK